MRDEYSWVVFQALKQLVRQRGDQTKQTDFDDVLSKVCEIKTTGEFLKWHRRLVAAGVELARPAAEAYEEANPRARCFGPEVACPLCGYTSGKPYGDGYKWPGGLERHLEGAGNTSSCDVMTALYKSVAEFTKETIEKTKAEAIGDMQRRHQTEPIYRFAPNEAAVLFNERWTNGFYGPAFFNDEEMRTPEELRWAEERLVSLGFQINRTGNLTTYTRNHGTFTVWADPRTRDRIEMKAYANKGFRYKRRLIGGGSSADMHETLSIQDRWKNDLTGKYEEQLPKEDAFRSTTSSKAKAAQTGTR